MRYLLLVLIALGFGCIRAKKSIVQTHQNGILSFEQDIQEAVSEVSQLERELGILKEFQAVEPSDVLRRLDEELSSVSVSIDALRVSYLGPIFALLARDYRIRSGEKHKGGYHAADLQILEQAARKLWSVVPNQGHAYMALRQILTDGRFKSSSIHQWALKFMSSIPYYAGIEAIVGYLVALDCTSLSHVRFKNVLGQACVNDQTWKRTLRHHLLKIAASGGYVIPEVSPLEIDDFMGAGLLSQGHLAGVVLGPRIDFDLVSSGRVAFFMHDLDHSEGISGAIGRIAKTRKISPAEVRRAMFEGLREFLAGGGTSLAAYRRIVGFGVIHEQVFQGEEKTCGPGIFENLKEQLLGFAYAVHMSPEIASRVPLKQFDGGMLGDVRLDTPDYTWAIDVMMLLHHEDGFIAQFLAGDSVLSQKDKLIQTLRRKLNQSSVAEEATKLTESDLTDFAAYVFSPSGQAELQKTRDQLRLFLKDQEQAERDPSFKHSFDKLVQRVCGH